MRVLVDYRLVISLGIAAIVGTLGLHTWPFPSDNIWLAAIYRVRPDVFAVLAYTYATLWFTTPCIIVSATLSVLFIFASRMHLGSRYAGLLPYPDPATRKELFLVLGERHNRLTPTRAALPEWLVVPERGLYTGIAVIGAIGTGKTSACMYPYVEQLLAYEAQDPERKVAALILEVKGDFCRQVRDILARHDRAHDYVEISLDSPYRYNPLHNDLDAYALAYGIATLMTNLFGRGKEPFWQQASTNLVKFVILLHQVLDDYVTLFQVYEHVISPDKLARRIKDGEEYFGDWAPRIVVEKADIAETAFAEQTAWHPGTDDVLTWTRHTPELESALVAAKVPYRIQRKILTQAESRRLSQFEAVKRWFEHDWLRIEPKLRTSIVEGISVFLSLFDDNPRVKHTFCPPRAVYEGESTPAHDGVPLPPLADLIEQGKVIGLNFPIAMNPGLARAIGTMLKQDFQRAVLNRIPRLAVDPTLGRPVVFLCDEYQAFATVGENEPSGDEKFFSLARQARCIPIVATQSLSSLRSTLPGESWRTLLQGFRTKIFLALSDDFSALVAAELCGRAERLKPSYTLAEGGQDARISLLTGRAGSARSSVTAMKAYAVTIDYEFQPKVFTELQNAQAIVLPYDGLNPLPPTYCYLKPHYLDVQTSYFDHVAGGVL